MNTPGKILCLVVPAEPTIGSIVRDRNGDAWQHISWGRDGRWRRTVGTNSRNWVRLLEDFGPAQLVYTPEDPWPKEETA